MSQCNLSKVAASVLLASSAALAASAAMAAHQDIAPIPADVIDAVVNRPVSPKAVMAEQFTQAVKQTRDALSRHAGPVPKLSVPQAAAYLASARSDVSAQRAALSSLQTELSKAFKSTAGAQAALRELAQLESALTKAARANQIEELRAHVAVALALLKRYEQANERDQAAAAPAHPTLSARTPYQLSPLPVAQSQPQYARNGFNGSLGVVTAAAGNAVLLPTPTEAASCSYTAADLDKTREEVNSVKYPELAALAKSLDYSPVKIFDYVYKNVDYKYNYFGSLKGAYGAYLTKQGNAFDQASLLVALLRASNIPSRYVFGNVEITDAAAWFVVEQAHRALGGDEREVGAAVLDDRPQILHAPRDRLQAGGQRGLPVADDRLDDDEVCQHSTERAAVLVE